MPKQTEKISERSFPFAWNRQRKRIFPSSFRSQNLKNRRMDELSSSKNHSQSLKKNVSNTNTDIFFVRGSRISQVLPQNHNQSFTHNYLSTKDEDITDHNNHCHSTLQSTPIGTDLALTPGSNQDNESLEENDDSINENSPRNVSKNMSSTNNYRFFPAINSSPPPPSRLSRINDNDAMDMSWHVDSGSNDSSTSELKETNRGDDDNEDTGDNETSGNEHQESIHPSENLSSIEQFTREWLHQQQETQTNQDRIDRMHSNYLNQYRKVTNDTTNNTRLVSKELRRKEKDKTEFLFPQSENQTNDISGPTLSLDQNSHDDNNIQLFRMDLF
eukprot:gb/GECH01004377.1/.p1 GENE.gb/GECH01004377.1/~~gb/GECH01004377.1/.p1  ORF type:complete len:330 (+),score=88.48 gb/GECH01004377.1/:1-990(+)